LTDHAHHKYVSKETSKIGHLTLDSEIIKKTQWFPTFLTVSGRVELPKTHLRFDFNQSSTFTKTLMTQMPQWLKLPFLRSWVFWALITCGLCGGMGYIALQMLFNPKAVPNCPELFLPMAPASLRVSCGQAAASKQTLKDLTAAFNFVKDIPADDPLRDFVDSNIQQWSIDLLRLAEGAYQKGDLKGALEATSLVPKNVKAYGAVKKRVEKWQKTWKEAEEIYEKTERLLRNSRWAEAYQIAVKLTKLNNEYWGTTRYQELADRVQVAKEDSAKLDVAHKLIKSNNLDDLLKAITIARKIDKKSYAYKEAQDLIAESGKQMLEIAKAQLNQNNWQVVLDITRQIPASPEIQVELNDVSTIAQAQSFARNGSIGDLEKAISMAQVIKPQSSVYTRSQELLTGWQLEISDLAYMQRAKNLAASGKAADLELAIREVGQIPVNNPLAKQAAAAIAEWRGQIQIGQDQPYYQAAEQAAASGTPTALQQGIAQMQQIRSGRALYNQAQQKIQQWSGQLQRMEDAPILESAEQQARNGNTGAAIALARRIGSGRALYGQAQERIGAWSGDSQATAQLSAAQQLASQGTPEALLGAIEAADKIPQGSGSYRSARASIDKWSSSMLQQAQAMAGQDLNRAIEIARVIPPGAGAYNAAQKAIQQWENSTSNDR
jgi:hypothetical protein